ncbi:type II toxin-antitoxin system RelE family toxin [Kiritimatiella glycovorans]|uniref:Toxin RelG n=1 Tax=Kiritimatiella glycovorans TaxID=1307763 RepID=A0A0G3EJ87_9BACT|nr:type II toxin-antitoxin system RelE/ParE family toxin [Kiritimatiella glycovorans]AKJ65502.1 Toxin RelG [Kiritimatiella glycovorans]
MAEYDIFVRKSVAKDLKRIPAADATRIVEAIRALGGNPRPPQARKLSGDEKYRLRCGAYRILYEIDDGKLVVCVVKAGHRKDIYR